MEVYGLYIQTETTTTQNTCGFFYWIHWHLREKLSQQVKHINTNRNMIQMNFELRIWNISIICTVQENNMKIVNILKYYMMAIFFIARKVQRKCPFVVNKDIIIHTIIISLIKKIVWVSLKSLSYYIFLTQQRMCIGHGQPGCTDSGSIGFFSSKLLKCIPENQKKNYLPPGDFCLCNNQKFNRSQPMETWNAK